MPNGDTCYILTMLCQPFTSWILILTNQQQTAFENIVGKGEIARDEQFLLFPQCLLLNQIIVSPFVHIFDMISFSFAAEFEKPKVGISGKGLKGVRYISKEYLPRPFLWTIFAKNKFALCPRPT